MRSKAPWFANDGVKTRAEAVFSEHRLGEVRSPRDLMEAVEAITGKKVIVDITNDREISSTTALWWDLGDEAHIILRSWDPPYYQVRGLHHELAHMLFDHPGCTALPEENAVSRVVPEGAKVRGRTPIDPHATGLLSGDAEIEGEAEYLSTLLAQALLIRTYDADDRVFG